MRVDGVTGTPESRVVRVERDRQIKLQLIKVLTLAVILLSLLVYLLLANLPGLFAGGRLRFMYSVYRLREPVGVSVRANGNFYVSEPINSRILLFDSNGDLIKTISATEGKGKVRGVYGSAIDEKRGEMYSADFMQRTIHVFDTEGKFLRRFPKNPLDKAFGDQGFVPFDVELYRDKVYVSTRNGLVIFDRKGKLKEVWGRKRGKKIGEFNFANGISIDQASGNIFVADTLNRRVVALDQKGRVRWVVGKPDSKAKLSSYFSLPRSIDIDPSGRLFITDTFEHHIVVLSQSGSLRSLIGERGVEDRKFNFPEGLAISSNRLVVADKGNDRVQVFALGSILPEPHKREISKLKSSFYRPSPDGPVIKVKRLRYDGSRLLPGQKL